MLKAKIRKQLLADRLLLSEQDYNELNIGILNQFRQLDFSMIKIIHIFLPITKKKEPNTFLLINWLAENHPEIRIIVPKAHFDSGLMTHHEYLGIDDLQNNSYHIPEPQNPDLYTDQIDMVLVPLLAFDKNGYRVGYGKGFYDRFLENINAQKIGLSLSPAIEKIDDINTFDIRLDFCITPTAIIKF